MTISNDGSLTVGTVADNGDALITNGADGGLYSVLTVKENGNSRFNLDFEGAGSTNSLTLDSNSTNDILNIMPDGTIYMGVEQGTLAKNSAHRLSVVNPSGASWISTFAYNGYPTLQLYRTNNNSPGSATGNFDATSDTDIIGAINWYGSSDSAHTLGAVIDVRQDGSASTNTPTRMDFYVSNGSNISNPLLSLDGPTQKVGIGTKVPGEIVHIYGAAGSSLMIEVTGGNDSKIDFKTTTTEYRMGANIGGVGNDTFSIKDMQAGGGTERVRIDSGGDFFTNDGSVSSLSDRRAKKDILDLEDGLSIINQLRPRTFKYNGRTVRPDDDVTRYGFIADEVLEVASQYVNIGEELLDGEMVDDFKTLSSTRMIPMMVNAIKELSKRIEELEK